MLISLIALGIPIVFIAVAGRSNGLGPVLSGNASFPVINCPPVKPDWGTEDIWSSLRLPSGRSFSQPTQSLQAVFRILAHTVVGIMGKLHSRGKLPSVVSSWLWEYTLVCNIELTGNIPRWQISHSIKVGSTLYGRWTTKGWFSLFYRMIFQLLYNMF